MAVDRLAARAFDAMAEEYERGRPGWPVAAVAEVVERHGVEAVTLRYRTTIVTTRRVDG